MSGIFGLLRFDDQTVDIANLSQMQAGMANWGPDGSALWNEGSIGLGHCLLRNTPESIYETSPLKNASSDLVLTASARLDNRAELCHAFGIPTAEQALTPDVGLILRAYERWGEDCVQHLLGDWALAIWDKGERRLFLARDHQGITGLFYYRGPHFFAFASSLAGLFALPEVPRQPNPLRVAEILLSWSKHGSATAYQDLYRLPPAHCFAVTAEPSEPRRYWYLEHTPDLHLKSDAEYVEAFLDIYTEAVRCRLRSLQPVGATLSGGLDSGSVCALAARELGKRGERLLTFTSVPVFDTARAVGRQRFGDERAFVEALVRFSGNIDSILITGEQIGPLAGIQQHQTLHLEPGHAASNAFWIMAILEAAQQRGLGALLIGQNGNVVGSWTGQPVAFWRRPVYGPRTGLQRALMRSIKSTGGWQAIRRFTIQAFRRSPLADLEPLATLTDSAIQPGLVKRLRLRQHQANEGNRLAFEARNAAYPTRYETLKPGASILGSHWASWGAGYALEVRDPTADKRLLEFCFAIPDAQYRSGQTDRWLIRRAMDGLLPDEMRLNQLRGQQSADIVGRVRANCAEIEALIDCLEHSELARDYLNLPLMYKTLTLATMAADRHARRIVDTILLRGLSAGVFLLEMSPR